MKTRRTIFTMVLLRLAALALLAGCASPESIPEEIAASQVRSENATNNSANSGGENLTVSNQNGNIISRRYELSAAAELLGISEDALISALGDFRINNQTDFSSAAEELGISEDELRDALFAIPMNERNNEAGKGNEQGAGQGNSSAGRQDNRQGNTSEDRQGIQQGYRDIDFASAAQALGISEEELRTAVEGNLGYGPPDFEVIAADLGKTEDELLEAIGHEHE